MTDVVESTGDEGLTRSEIFNTYGEELGRRLLDAGFASLSGLIMVEDEVLAERGFSEEEIATIREPLIVEETGENDGMEEDAADEPQDEEAVADAVEAAEPVVEAEADKEGSEEVLSDEPAVEAPEGAETLTIDEATAIASAGAMAVAVAPVQEEEVPFGIEGGMSVRVRRNKERAAAEEAERKRAAAIEDANYVGPFDSKGFDLGSVNVNFVPEPDPEPTDGEPEAPEVPLGDGIE